MDTYRLDQLLPLEVHVGTGWDGHDPITAYVLADVLLER